MTFDRAKEIVQVGFAWANWTSEQKEAFRTLLLETEKASQLKKENDILTNQLFDCRTICEIGCNWCQGKRPSNFECSMLDDDGNTIVVEDNDVVRTAVNFCPVCGKSLRA